MLRRLRGVMADDSSRLQVPRRACAWVPKAALLLAAGLVGVLVPVCYNLCTWKQREPMEPIAAELQLNHTGLQQDPRLRWQAGPALGRSFLHGLELNNGQLRVLQDGIYRLHIQVTLANCSSPQRTRSQQATLAISVCGPATHQTTLLRLSFYSDCTVASQRLTRLAAGDTLCTDLTGPLQASPNTDETFFGIERVHP